MSESSREPTAKSHSIPLPAEGFMPTTTRFRAERLVKFELPTNCIEFYNNDEGYRKWCRDNPDGWVMNNYRRNNGPIPAHKQDMEKVLTVHHVTDHERHLNRSSTTLYHKLCCVERQPLEDFKRTIIAATTDV